MVKSLKRFLALVLALSMVMSMMCVTAFADGTDETEAQEPTETVAEPTGEGLEEEPSEPQPQTTTDVDEPSIEGAKFAVVVSSKLSDNSTTYVYGTVDADYQAKLVLPGPAEGTDDNPLAKVNAGNATIGVYMNDVASLGGGNKSYVKTIYTGLDNIETTIANNAPQLYEFKGTTINANIIDGDDKASVTYTLSKAQAEGSNTVINGTATEADARAAWQMMTSYIKAGSKPEDDSFIVIAPNSWLQIGNDVLVFEDDHAENLVLDNITAENLANLNTQIRQAVKLENADEEGLSFCLGKGTTLALSNSSAELTKDVVVTVSSEDANLNGLNGVLSDLQGGVGADGKDVILGLLGLMNKALETVEGKELTVDIDFTEPEVPVEEETAKFKVEVSSELSDGSITKVTGTVDKDYNAKLVLPNKKVNAGNVTVKVSMTDVASLGIVGTRTHEMTLGTGATAEGPLFTALDVLEANALRDFTDATIKATIKSSGKEANVTYTLKGSDWNEEDPPTAKTITGTPDSAEAARAAWALMVNADNFTTGTQDADSKIVIANGSSLQIGKEVLKFEDDYTDDLVLDNIANMKVEDITKAVKLTTANDAAMTFTLKKGTTLAVSSSIATLEKDVTVTVDGVKTDDLHVLSEIKTAVNNPDTDAKDIIIKLIGLMNTAIELVDEAEGEIGVTIEFRCNHEDTEIRNAKDATCTEAGYTGDTVCAKCDEVIVEGTEIQALGHTPDEAARENVADATCSTAGSYDEVVYCTECEAELSRETKTTDALGHDMQDVADSAKDPTCTEAGKGADKACSRCDETETGAVIDALGHTEEAIAAVAATCETAGSTAGVKCSVCGEVLTAPETIEALGHTWGDWTVTTPAAVGVAGVETRTCSACGAEETRDIPALSAPSTPSTTTTRPRPVTPPVEVEEENPPLVEVPISAIFADVADDAWYAGAIRFAYTNDLMVGVDDGSKFGPAQETTRGMIATILYRVEGTPSVADLEVSFPDVADDSWYHDAAVWALSAGVFTGYDDGSFHGDDVITREQLATVLYRYAEIKGWDLDDVQEIKDLADYVDGGEVAGWAETAVRWAASAGLITGRSATSIAPRGDTQRCELATVLMRMADKYAMFGSSEVIA